MYQLETPGLLIAVEGIDAAGSSSLAANLTRLMNERALRSFATKEPTDNLIGGLIRAALTKVWKPSPRTLQQLFVADRSHHLDLMILPNLRQGNHVISDRYAWSTLAFGAIDLEPIELVKMNDAYPMADLTFVVDAAVETTQARLGKRDHLEIFEKKSYQEMVRDNYLLLVAQYPGKAWALDGRKSQEELAQEALEIVLQHPLIRDGKRLPYRWIDPDLDCLLGHPDRKKIHHSAGEEGNGPKT